MFIFAIQSDRSDQPGNQPDEFTLVMHKSFEHEHEHEHDYESTWEPP
jgi:hypothetical protein